MAKNELPEGVEPLWTREQAAKFLNVHPQTVSKLIKQYRLPAVKIGKEWRFRLEDLEIYVWHNLTTRGLLSLDPLVFWKEVLEKYQKEPDQYYVDDRGHYGLVGNKRNKYNRMCGAKPYREDFVDVFYNRIRLKDGREVIVIKGDELEKIPSQERPHWYGFQIKNPESLPLPWSPA